VADKPVNDVWTEIPMTITPSVDMNELEDAFSMDPDGAEGSRAVSQGSKRQSVTTVLDITRANNVGESKTCSLGVGSRINRDLQLLCYPA
jgi:hypothetical protein